MPYLKQLGITHLYASPFLKARPGSTHGYDIVDHERLNPELGGDEGFARLSDALKQHDLGLILDFVPNHMGVGHADNAWWLDVLEWGPKSPYAAFFDIDWDALPHRRHPGVLLPILGRPYGDALQACEIELKYDAASGSFDAWYFDHKLPINPQRYRDLVRTLVQTADAGEAPAGKALLDLVENHLDPATPSYREAPALKRSLADISGAAEIIEHGLPAFRGDSEVRHGRAAPAARAPALSARLLARRILGGELPPFLRYQRPRRPACRKPRYVSRYSWPSGAADFGRPAAGASTRSYRWPARPGAVRAPPAAIDRPIA